MGPSYFHGKDGFNDVSFGDDDRPDVERRVAKENAVDALRRIVRDNPGMDFEAGQAGWNLTNLREIWNFAGICVGKNQLFLRSQSQKCHNSKFFIPSSKL